MCDPPESVPSMSRMTNMSSSLPHSSGTRWAKRMSRSAAIWLRPNPAGRGPGACLSHGDAGHSLSTECKVESPLPNAVNSLPHLQTKWKELKKKKVTCTQCPSINYLDGCWVQRSGAAEQGVEKLQTLSKLWTERHPFWQNKSSKERRILFGC